MRNILALLTLTFAFAFTANAGTAHITGNVQSSINVACLTCTGYSYTELSVCQLEIRDSGDNLLGSGTQDSSWNLAFDVTFSASVRGTQAHALYPCAARLRGNPGVEIYPQSFYLSDNSTQNVLVLIYPTTN